MGSAANRPDLPSGAGRGRSMIHIVLPAFNEGRNIGRLLDRIQRAMADEDLAYRVVLVDDGSSDDTIEAACRFGNEVPLEVVRHEKNQGLGATLRDGLNHVIGGLDDHDIVITMDADDSHVPGLIPRMCRRVREGHDVVIASRFRPGARVYGVPLMRQLFSLGACFIFRLMFPTSHIRDFTCGYRAYRGSALKRAAEHYGAGLVDIRGFQCMVDLILKLHQLGMIIGEVPMILRYDLKEGQSKMRVGSTVRGTLSVLVARRFGGGSA